MLHRRLAPAFLIATVACSSLRPVSDPMRYIAEKNPPVVFVGYVRNGVGFTHEMANPRVVGDSVVGTWIEGNRPAAVPVRDVQSIASVRRDGPRTALLVFGIAAATGMAAYSFYNGAAGRNNWQCDWSPNMRGPAGEPNCGPITQ